MIPGSLKRIVFLVIFGGVLAGIVLPIALISPSRQLKLSSSLKNGSYYKKNEERCIKLNHISNNKTTFEEALETCLELVTNFILS